MNPDPELQDKGRREAESRPDDATVKKFPSTVPTRFLDVLMARMPPGWPERRVLLCIDEAQQMSGHVAGSCAPGFCSDPLGEEEI